MQTSSKKVQLAEKEISYIWIHYVNFDEEHRKPIEDLFTKLKVKKDLRSKHEKFEDEIFALLEEDEEFKKLLFLNSFQRIRMIMDHKFEPEKEKFIKGLMKKNFEDID